MFLASVQNTGSAIRAIDVKPEFKLIRDGGDLCERIDYTGVNSSGTADDTKRAQTVAQVRFDTLPQCVNTHTLAFVARDHTHLISPDAENVSRLRDRHVYFFRSVDRHRRPGIPKPLMRHIRAPATGYEQRDHICHRATTGQKTVSAGVITNQRS